MSTYSKSLPASWYYDTKVFDEERKAVFGSEWLYVGEEHDLKGPGDYVKIDLAGYPLLLVRGKDAKIRCFHNVCRHRAAPLVTDKQGTLKGCALTCRYHGWTYDLAGELISAPHFDTADLNEKFDTSLFEVQTASYQGLIFANLNPRARPFSEVFQPIQNEIERTGYSMDRYTEYLSMEKEGQFNWKVWMDGFQECYHCTTIHPIFTRDFALKKYKVENKERFSLHSCERRHKSEMGGFEGLWLWLYPNLGLPCYEPCFYTLQVNPLSPNRTRLSYRFRFKKECADQAQEFIKTIETITMEDVTICELVQKNLEAGVYQQGVLHPEREIGVSYFQGLVRTAVQR